MSASSSKSSRSLSLRPGILDVDEELTKKSERPVIAVNIHVCSRPIEGKIGATVPKIEHEYLLLHVKLKSGEHFWIRAEKYGSSGDSAGIHVKPAVNIHDEVENNAIMRCSKCGEILMKDLIKTLTDHTPNYQLVSQNCMDYARDTFKKLLELF
jgi:formylmethanofuran dehydrogenase subunit E